ncbi:hypothetical protein VULLAG_LOCUS4955 [Vulpes lagopus]
MGYKEYEFHYIKEWDRSRETDSGNEGGEANAKLCLSDFGFHKDKDTGKGQDLKTVSSAGKWELFLVHTLKEHFCVTENSD